jgi:YYY domain-containing protein
LEQTQSRSIEERVRKGDVWWAIPLLVVTMVIGGYLRFTGLDWDDYKWIHPDESHMQQMLGKIHTPDSGSFFENIAIYFDTHRSPLNERNSGDRYSYGTLPLFLVRFTAEGLDQAEWLDQMCDSLRKESSETGEAPTGVRGEVYDLLCSGDRFTGYRSKLVGRLLSATADMGTILVVFFIGRRLGGSLTGVLAANLTAVTAFLIQQAHFFTVDSTMCFFMTLAAYFAVRASRTGEWSSFALAGLSSGLAAACKISGGLVSLMVALAAAVWLWSQTPTRRWWGLWNAILRLTVAGVLCLIAFRVTNPYAFEGPGFFGVKISPEWRANMESLLHVQSSDWDGPPAQQWTNRTPLLFPWNNIVFWGMGVPLGLAAWIGWAVMGFGLWRGKRVREHLLLWVWTTLMFLYLGTRWVKSMRYFIFLYPMLILMGAWFLVRLCRSSARWWRAAGYGLSVVVVVGSVLWGYAVFSIYQREHTRLAAGQWIFDNIPAYSVLAQEHWDWGPHIPGGKQYTIFEMLNYHEDTLEKRGQLFDWLDQADYIVTSSNRIYASVARLEPRYPLTTEYYRALFAGELGFELAADFTSCPALFGWFQFPDQETPYPLMEATDYVYQQEPIVIHLPPAEEAFSVYDHPRVLIFRKTDDYSRERVMQVLGGIDVEKAYNNLKPVELTAVPDLMEFDEQTWADQQAGGTWSEMFNSDGLFNRYPGLAAFAWWLAVMLLGWLAFPLLFVSLPRLRDRGYGLARVLALLVLAYLTWIAASLHVLPNTRGTILRMLGLLLLVGGGVGWFKRAELQAFVRRHWRLLLVTEGLFALLYVLWIGVRLLQPDLWHPHMGGEKPMDFAYLNAVIKSTWFPPYNPWLSGTYINYYYFGFVIVGTLTKLLGTVPATAYNLMVPLLYALTGVGAFSVAYNLMGRRKRAALVAGILALVFTIVLGNLGVVHLVYTKLIELGGEPFESTIPGYPELVSMFEGIWKVVVEGHSLSIGNTSWYWHPTRIIPAETGNPIAEFPAFTFLYADLHAHLISFPLTLLALALALYWVLDSRPRWWSLVIGGLVVGSLRPTNTWDYPAYLMLGLAALMVGAWDGWRAERRRTGLADGMAVWRHVRQLVLRAVLFAGLTFVLFLPYIQHYSGYSSLERWDRPRTPADIYLWIHTIMLFPVVTRLLVEVWRVLKWRKDSRCGFAPRSLRSIVLASGGGLVFVVFLIVCLAGGVALWKQIGGIGTSVLDEIVPVSLVALPIALLAALLLFVPGMPANRRLLWLMVGLVMAISIAVEVVVVKGDVGRQNTVFKFYLQMWIMLSVAAGVSIVWLYERSKRWRPKLCYVWWGVMTALVLGGLLFLPFGIYARASDRMSPDTGLTLDGMAFMKYSKIDDGPEGNPKEIYLYGDYAAIRWMQDNIEGSPVILEGLGWREYLWANRVSIYTGLPAVVGWRWHEVQQRPLLPADEVNQRREDVRVCYETRDINYAMRILGRYGVRYIYVGGYEQAYYSAAGLAKFDTMAEQGLLRVVYDSHGVKIYEVSSEYEMSLQ